MDGGGELTVQQLPNLIKEWMTSEEELRTLSAEIREKRKRAKTVRDMVMRIMKSNKVGRLNISAGAVTTHTKATKAPMSKKYVVDALTTYFAGDRAKAEACAKFLDENRPLKTTENLALDPITTPST
jgi:hypothetical protein